MARPRKYVIKLTDDELKTLKSIIRKSNTSKTIRSRCQIIIDLDEAHGKVLTHEQSARSNGVCLTTVTNTVTKYFSGGIEAVTEFKRNINSDNARRILDGRAEARIIELACGPVPEGHSRWTLRLLEKEAKVVLDTPVSKDAIRRALKKTNFDLTKMNTGAFPQERTQNLWLVWRMFSMYTNFHITHNAPLFVWTKNHISYLARQDPHFLCAPAMTRK